VAGGRKHQLRRRQNLITSEHNFGNKMPTTHSLDNLKHYHNQAMQFFDSELMLLKEAIPKIYDDRLGKAAMLLISANNTGVALLQLAYQTDTFTNESVMLARSFMEKLTNFCYVGICDEKEYRAFVLHPVYKQYHNAGKPKMEEDQKQLQENIKIREERQVKLREKSIVKEALGIFSETNPRMNWTKKTLSQRIEALETWGKLFDVFFTISKLQYYSDASEILHGSLYGCTYSIGAFEPGFDPTNNEELSKKTYKDGTCMLLHLGILVHEVFTLINYTNDIKNIWDYSYRNRGTALNLLLHVIETKGFEPVLPKSVRDKPSMNNDICAGGFLYKKNRFLFGKRSKKKDWAPGFWDIVGGHSLKNEHSLITLQREIVEETGITVLNAELITTANVFKESNGKILFKYYIYVVTHFKGKVINHSKEHSQLKWFTREELDKIQLALPAYLTLIDEWLARKTD
jgi:8-oxo-dGTP pyrophosphatase MutT (NUDIX family)